MASIYKEILVEADPEQVWQAIRDVGAVHQRLVPGVRVDAYLEGDARVVTFANGMVVCKLTVTLGNAARRFVYASVGRRSSGILSKPDTSLSSLGRSVRCLFKAAGLCLGVKIETHRFNVLMRQKHLKSFRRELSC